MIIETMNMPYEAGSAKLNKFTSAAMVCLVVSGVTSYHVASYEKPYTPDYTSCLTAQRSCDHATIVHFTKSQNILRFTFILLCATERGCYFIVLLVSVKAVAS